MLAPCLFQKHIQKPHELRVTVVGQKIFPIKINSQETEETRIDWRRDQSLDAYHLYEITKIPLTLERRIYSYMRSEDLKYGAFDFIVSPNGKYFFLECNAAGQWLWLEDATGAQISTAVAELLIERGV